MWALASGTQRPCPFAAPPNDNADSYEDQRDRDRVEVECQAMLEPSPWRTAAATDAVALPSRQTLNALVGLSYRAALLMS